MNKTITISILVIAFIAGFLVFYNPKPASSPTQDGPSASSTQQKWETKTDDQAAVNVVVTPLDLSPQSSEWKFDVGLNTHSVELDQDMTQVAKLVDDGKEYRPLRWEGAPAGGHHREGVFTFNRITPIPQHLKLSIDGIGNVQRSFEWILIEEE